MDENVQEKAKAEFKEAFKQFNNGQNEQFDASQKNGQNAEPGSDSPPKGGEQPPNGGDTPPADEYRTKYEALEKEVGTLREKANKAEEYKALLDSDQFDGDADVQLVAKLKKQGVSLETIVQYKNMDISKMTPYDQKVLLEQLEKPTIPKEKIEKFVKQQYGLGEYAPIGEDGETRNEQDGLDRLEYEAAGAEGISAKLAKQKEELVKVAAKPRSQVAQEISQKELTAQWSKEIPTFESTLKAYEAKIEGLESPLKVELEGYGQEKLDEYIQTIAKSGHKVTPEALDVVKKQILKDAIYDNLNKILHEAAKASQGKLDKKYLDELHNPSKFQSAPKSAGAKETPKEELERQLKERGMLIPKRPK